MQAVMQMKKIVIADSAKAHGRPVAATKWVSLP